MYIIFFLFILSIQFVYHKHKNVKGMGAGVGKLNNKKILLYEHFYMSRLLEVLIFFFLKRVAKFMVMSNNEHVRLLLFIC